MDNSRIQRYTLWIAEGGASYPRKAIEEVQGETLKTNLRRSNINTDTWEETTLTNYLTFIRNKTV